MSMYNKARFTGGILIVSGIGLTVGLLWSPEAGVAIAGGGSLITTGALLWSSVAREMGRGTNEQAEERASMSSDTKWIIGTVIAVAGLLATQITGLNTRIADVREGLYRELDNVQDDLREMRGDIRELLSRNPTGDD